MVVPDGCTDLTAQVARALRCSRPVSVPNVGAARRAGARAALASRPGEVWLASTDADSEVPAGWLTGMMAEARQGAHVVLGTVLPAPELCPETRAEWLGRHPPPRRSSARSRRQFRDREMPMPPQWPGDRRGRGSGPARGQASDLKIVRMASIPVVTSARWAGRGPRGFSGSVRALSAPAPSRHTCRPGIAELITWHCCVVPSLNSVGALSGCSGGFSWRARGRRMPREACGGW